MSKTSDPSFFIEWLRDATARAAQKMELEQKKDPNCVWAEFETLILALEDFFKEAGVNSGAHHDRNQTSGQAVL